MTKFKTNIECQEDIDKVVSNFCKFLERIQSTDQKKVKITFKKIDSNKS